MDSSQDHTPRQSAALKIAAVYAVAGALWILCTGWLLHHFVQDRRLAAAIEDVKGWFYVLVTAMLLGWWLNRYFRQIRRAASLLQKSEARFATIFRDSPIAVAISRLSDGVFVDANQAFAQLHGRPREDIIGRTPEQLQLWYAGNGAQVIAELHKKAHLVVEMQCRRTSGEVRDLSASLQVIELDGESCILESLLDFTERKKTEGALRESEERLRFALETSRTGAWDFDMADHTAYRSVEHARIFGYTEGSPAWTYELFLEHVLPEDRAAVDAKVRTAIAACTDWSVECRIRRVDGQVRWIWAAGRHVLTSSGQARRVAGIVQDITERKQAELALHESEARLRTLGDNLPGGALYQLLMPPDRPRRFTYVSAGFEKIFGLPPEHILANAAAFYNLIVDDDRRSLQAEEERCARAMTVFDMEFRQHTVTGEVKWIHACSTPRRLEDGSILWDGVATDITERKRAEATLRAREEIFSTIVSQAIDAVAVIEGETARFVEFNTAAHEGLGYTREQFSGLGVKDIQAEHSPEVIARNIATILDHGGLTFESKHRRRDGEIRDVRVSARPLFHMGHRYIAAVWTDITESKRVQLEMETQVEFLREASTSRTSRELIETAVRFVQRHSGCEAVGIRLQEGDDYPYFEARGFPQEFLQLENSLCTRDAAGNVLRDAAGNVRLECMCGNVISGRIDPSQPFFTKHGSFWSNDTTRLLATTTPTERQSNTRNRCNGEGYESVALMPLVAGDQRLGLLQLNDRRRCMFTPERIALWERVAGYLAVALTKCRAEAALQESEARMRLFIEHAPAALAMFDRGMRYLAVSRRWISDYGLENREILGRSHYEVFPEIGERLKQIHRRGMAGEVVRDDDTRFERADGTVQYVRWEMRPWRDNSGGVGGIVIFTEDISERKRAETALRESEARFRSLIEGAPEAVFVQCGGVFRYANQAMVKLVGATRVDDLLGHPFIECIAPEYHDAVRERIQSQREKGVASLPMEQNYLRLDGTQVPVETSAVAIRFQGQDGHLVFVRDITGRREAEKERTSLEAQLRHAQKMESVGRLAGGVAHDFNNLLMGIMGHTELCRDDLGRAHSVCTHLDAIMDAAQRSAGITRQLLAFARKQAIAPVVLDLNDHVEATLKLLRRLVGEDVELAWTPQARDARVKMDPSQVDQILANLAVNARDAISGVGRVIVETGNIVFDAAYCSEHKGATPGAYVMLAFSDSGCGMDRETLAHIFEPFFTTKPAGKGTGLGLATIYGIVKQNEGLINVSSEPGKGTTFRIYFPHHAEEVAETKHDGEPPDLPRGTETVMLVEDEKSVRLPTGLILQALGYQVLSASAPDDALRQAAEYRGVIHLLITDVVLPGMNGRDLAMRLSDLQPGLVCLYVSGYTADVIAHHGILDPGVHFLAKPFARDDLAHKIRDVLRGRPSKDRH